ncbi:MAG: hypothetical protein R3Y64_08775 [Peptostreptococcaceae bacterium]
MKVINRKISTAKGGTGHPTYRLSLSKEILLALGIDPGAEQKNVKLILDNNKVIVIKDVEL